MELGRIEVRGDRYVVVDPGLTLARFGWDEEAAEGLTWTRAAGTVIPLEDDEAAEEA